MLKKMVQKSSVMVLFGALIPMSACAGEKIVNCEHEMLLDISQEVVLGSERSVVESYLHSIGADFSYHDKDELVAIKDKDADQFGAKIIVIVNLPAKGIQLITSSELMTIGFDKSDLVQVISCEKIYTDA